MMTYRVFPSKHFRKDVRRLERSGGDLSKLKNIVSLLKRGERLDPVYRDHALKGNLKGKRACHIGPDWLLSYEKDEDRLILLLLRTGDHRKVLGIE